MVNIVKLDSYRSSTDLRKTNDRIRVEMRMPTYEWRQVMLALRKAGIKVTDKGASKYTYNTALNDPLVGCTELHHKIKKAHADLDAARELPCTCTGFVLQYEGSCQCDRGRMVANAEATLYNLTREISNETS
jgi:hypothetical protein